MARSLDQHPIQHNWQVAFLKKSFHQVWAMYSCWHFEHVHSRANRWIDRAIGNRMLQSHGWEYSKRCWALHLGCLWAMMQSLIAYLLQVLHQEWNKRCDTGSWMKMSFRPWQQIALGLVRHLPTVRWCHTFEWRRDWQHKHMSYASRRMSIHCTAWNKIRCSHCIAVVQTPKISSLAAMRSRSLYGWTWYICVWYKESGKKKELERKRGKEKERYQS